MIFRKLKSYLDMLTVQSEFRIHSSWAQIIVYRVVQEYPSADWADVVKRSAERLQKKYELSDDDARDHVVYALRAEGAFVVPPRVARAQQKNQEQMRGGI